MISTLMPASASNMAVKSPTGPAPTTSTSVRSVFIVVLSFRHAGQHRFAWIGCGKYHNRHGPRGVGWFIQRMFLLLPMFGDFSIPAGPVEGINIRVENDVIQMPNDDGQTGENRFIIMDRQGNVHGPAREKASDIHFEPNHDAADSHNDGAPHDGPILDFLGIPKARDFGLCRRKAGEIARVAGEILKILFRRE